MARGLEHIDRAGLAEEYRVEALADGVFETQSAGGIGLGVKVNEKDSAT
jgi:hypothetical protein